MGLNAIPCLTDLVRGSLLFSDLKSTKSSVRSSDGGSARGLELLKGGALSAIPAPDDAPQIAQRQTLSFSGEEKEQKVERINTLKVIFIRIQIGVTRGDCVANESFFHSVRAGGEPVEKAGDRPVVEKVFSPELFLYMTRE